MSTTRTLTPSPPPASALHQRSAMRSAPPSDSEPPPLEERLNEVLSLAGVVPVSGPPIILFVGAWVLFALMLAGPFLLLVTFVLGAVVLVVPIAAILAPLYLLVRHVRVLITDR
jgi:hypothetical protein